MASSPSKLSLDCKTHMALKSFAGQNSDQTYKVEEIISQLEEERLKIDAFKRELPLCMQLLTNAMEASRQQLQVFKVNQGTRPVLEEFIPIKHSTYESCSAEKETKTTDNKADWMTSAQLWSQASEGTKQQPTTIITSFPKEAADNIGFSMNPSLVLNNNNKQGNHNGGGGAFLPFSKERNSTQISALRALPELALASGAEKEIEDKKCEEPCLKMENSSNGGTDGMVVDQGKGPSHAQNATTVAAVSTTQTHRKARRCWSPELHRRFVNALQMLGGSQVATPKQIRELMKVDGLTNDEVKSHLQKYRLHTRRPSPGPQTGAPAPQLVVLGGIWVPPEYATAGAPTLYGAHPNSVPQEFYTAAPPQQLLPPPPPHQNVLHHHHHHQLMHVYKTTPQKQSSPEYDVQEGSESIEDGKSESSSWKGESGENDGERKGLQYEESNGSQITLKF
ncbi:unnamed protein product [Lupinus luteus]|uniref:HTH myb-type domain-containing protein n=1 Tax=Lupinus luteus TaxID=3873 RepID=A0AAV1Y960_LUPLU